MQDKNLVHIGCQLFLYFFPLSYQKKAQDQQNNVLQPNLVSHASTVEFYKYCVKIILINYKCTPTHLNPNDSITLYELVKMQIINIQHLP